MRSRLTSSLGVALLVLLCARSAQAEAILTVGGVDLVPDENGMLQLNVDVDLAGTAPNLVSFDLDVLFTGLQYVSHTIGDVLDGDGDLSTIEYFDATMPDPLASTQNVLAILESGVGATVGRLFSMNLLVTDPGLLSLSLLGFPIAEVFDGNFRSESLVSEVAPLDLQAVPFVIRLVSTGPGVVTMVLTAPGGTDPDPTDPPASVPEPGALALLGLGLITMAAAGRRLRLATT